MQGKQRPTILTILSSFVNDPFAGNRATTRAMPSVKTSIPLFVTGFLSKRCHATPILLPIALKLTSRLMRRFLYPKTGKSSSHKKQTTASSLE
jgi:hypothetical protein